MKAGGRKGLAGASQSNFYLSLRVYVSVTLLSAFNSADLSITIGCNYSLSHIVSVSNIDILYLTEMDTTTDLSGLHVRVKSGGDPYTYSI